MDNLFLAITLEAACAAYNAYAQAQYPLTRGQFGTLVIDEGVVNTCDQIAVQSGRLLYWQGRESLDKAAEV